MENCLEKVPLSWVLAVKQLQQLHTPRTLADSNSATSIESSRYILIYIFFHIAYLKDKLLIDVLFSKTWLKIGRFQKSQKEFIHQLWHMAQCIHIMACNVTNVNISVIIINHRYSLVGEARRLPM